jgi:NAD+ synthase (glutamine-hydrolysing)
MEYGFVKVGAISKKIKISDVEYNKKNIIDGILEAKDSGVNLLVFPELSLTGNTAGDLFYFDTLLSSCERAVTDILTVTIGLNMAVVLGMPLKVNSLLYDVAVVIFDGKILGIVPKTYLSNFNEYYENRWFNPAPEDNIEVDFCGQIVPFGKKLLFKAKNFDTFTFGVEIGDDASAIFTPSSLHAINGATIIANPSCSEEIISKNIYRRDLVSAISSKNIVGYVLSNAGEGESTTDMVYSGHSVIAEYGKVLVESDLFKNTLITTEIDTSFISFERSKKFKNQPKNTDGYTVISFDLVKTDVSLTRKYEKTPFVPLDKTDLDKRAQLVLDIQANALKARLEHTYAKTAVIGLSGGLDSTLALLVSVRAMTLLNRPLKDIVGVTMPCFGTTSRTLNNTIALAKTLGITLKKIDISKSVTKHLKDIKHDLKTLDVTYENAQARERTQVIMDIANMTGGLVIGTGDLSELALGWATYNGDHMSMYGVNSSIPKTLVKHLVSYVALNSKPKLKSVLSDILATPVSPELLPAENNEISQKTEEIVGPYILHDFYLYSMIRLGYSPKKIYKMAKYTFNGDFKDETILKWLKIFVRRFFNQQFKRSCVPDGVKVGSVALSPRGDWRMPSDATSSLWLSELEDL